MRQAPPPRPAATYTHSANMPGYEEELMPRRRSHAQADNSIEFPMFPQSRQHGTPPAGRDGAPRRSGPPRQENVTELPPRRPGRGAKRAAQAGRTQSGPRTHPEQEARRKKKITKATMRRRRFMRRFAAIAALLCVVAVGAFLTMTMLFKITAIEVRDPDGALAEQVGAYSRSEILAALGVQLEENIFSFSAGGRAAEMEKQLPLLEDIQVQRSYPGTVVVRATPAVAVCTMPTSRGWLGLSASLKILSLEQQQPALPILYGGEPASTTPGEQLSFRAEAAAPAAGAASGSAAGSEAASGSEASAPQEDTRMEVLQKMLDALNETGLVMGATRLEFADTEQVAFLYENRISVLLGTVNELEYKMEFARSLLLNVDGKGCAPTDTGRIDCSHLRTDGTLQAIFAQGEPVLPSGYVVPEPAPAPEPAGPEAADPEATEPEAAGAENAAAGDAAVPPEAGEPPQAGTEAGGEEPAAEA